MSSGDMVQTIRRTGRTCREWHARAQDSAVVFQAVGFDGLTGVRGDRLLSAGPGEDDLYRRHHQHHDGDDALAAADLPEDRVDLNADGQGLREEGQRHRAHSRDGLGKIIGLRRPDPGRQREEDRSQCPDEVVGIA